MKDLGPLLAIWGAAMLVLVQTSDLGSALLNFGIFLAMLYIATGRALYVGIGLVMFAGGAAALYNALDRVHQRVTVWLEPWTDDKVFCSINGQLDYRQHCDSYQLVKSLYSIANGGYGGTGIGKGTFETLDGTQLIPLLQTDFVYSAVAQELGLIGAAALLLLFLVVVARGMRIALLAQDGFSKLLAAGLTFGFALQTFIIVGGVLRVVPLTGITLPFVSYGGSSTVSNFALIALLCSCRTAPSPPLVHEPAAAQGDVGGYGDARDARRGHHLLADVGATRARCAAGQRDSASRGVRDQARPDPGPDAGARTQPPRATWTAYVLLPPLPAGEAGCPCRGLLDHRP